MSWVLALRSTGRRLPLPRPASAWIRAIFEHRRIQGVHAASLRHPMSAPGNGEIAVLFEPKLTSSRIGTWLQFQGFEMVDGASHVQEWVLWLANDDPGAWGG